MPFFTPGAYVGIGVETTRGTPAESLTWFPTDLPEWGIVPTYLEDKSLRGGPVDIYSEQIGVRHDTLNLKGFVYLDTFPNLIRAALGSTDSITAAATATTLSAAAEAGATSVKFTGTVASGSVVVISSTSGGAQVVTAGATSDEVTTITPALVNAQPDGATVTGLTLHELSVLNSVSAGFQPPSYTLAFFTAGEAGSTTARQFAGSQLDTCSLSFAADAALSFEAAFLCNPATEACVSAPSFSDEWFVPAWSCAVEIESAVSDVITEGSIDIKRSTGVINTLGQQSPYRIWAGPIGVTGKINAILETGDLTITNGTTRVVDTFNLLFTEPVSQHQLNLQMSQVQLRDPKLNGSKTYMSVDADFLGEGNTTDAVGGGYANILATVANAQTASY